MPLVDGTILNTYGISLNRDNEAFVINLSVEKYERIKSDMVEVQSLYDNHDSIIVCPVSSDILRSMKIIGQNINLDVITQSKSTLFF